MIKLLLVEDDESLAYIEKTGLEDIIGGYKVTTAINGKEGLKAWEDHGQSLKRLSRHYREP